MLPKFNAGLQWYVEETLNWDRYAETAPPSALARDRFRHLLTLRLTRMAMHDDLELSLFAFWSPTDEDGYLRPRVSYRIDDFWTASAGGNLFAGEAANTFWGQFEDASNIWASLRRSF